MIDNITIVGGGALGLIISAYIGSRCQKNITILTSHPTSWNRTITATDLDGKGFTHNLTEITNDPESAVKNADMIIFCVPGFLNRKNLTSIKPFLQENTIIGGIFASNGFMFEAMDILDSKNPIFGFQRGPFIGRLTTYGSHATILGYKSKHKIAIERANEKFKDYLLRELESLFGAPIALLNSYLEASLSNSNPLLHPARLYDLFGYDFHSRQDIPFFDHNPKFYAEWSERAAKLYIEMDNELSTIIKHLPVNPSFLPSALEYYESTDAKSLAKKLQSIPAFKPIKSPMIRTDNGWIPDFTHRYFIEDFNFGLRYICELSKKSNVPTPWIDKIYNWGKRAIAQNSY